MVGVGATRLSAGCRRALVAGEQGESGVCGGWGVGGGGARGVARRWGSG